MMETQAGYRPTSTPISTTLLATRRQRYIRELRLPEMRESAHGLLVLISSNRAEVNRLKSNLRTATEAVELHEALLMGAEAYVSGKNAEIRAAWLKRQRVEDAAFAALVQGQRDIERRLAESEARADGLGREYQLCLAEMRLASAQLQFLAGGEG